MSFQVLSKCETEKQRGVNTHQSRQMRVPKETEAHCGFFAAQSAQVLLSGRDWISRSAALIDAASIVQVRLDTLGSTEGE